MGLLDDIKNQVKKSGTNKGKFIYFRPDTKVRLRFLSDLEEGFKVDFHDSFSKGINAPCQEAFGRKCKYCGDEELRTRTMYCWSVWDHEAKEVKLFLFPVSSASPVPPLVAMYETYGTLTDRDYVITKNGSGPGLTFSVVPMDKAKFTNNKAKAYTESAILKMIDKAFSDESTDDEDEDEDERPKKKAHAKGKVSKADIDEDEADDKNTDDYAAMSPKELYGLCKERDIEVEPKKPSKYYIEKLKEADEEDWGNEDDEEDEW